MSFRPRTSRRIGAGALALAAFAAAMPLLIGTVANADGPAVELELERVDLAHTAEDERMRPTAAAGTCTPYEVRARTAQGAPADAATITVTIAESPLSGSHDVDFCLVDGQSVFVNAPGYTSQQNLMESTQDLFNEYNAGPSITTSASGSGSPPAGSDVASPNQPDSASAGSATPPTGPNSNNPTGTDNATIRTVNGVARFGVVGNVGGGVTIDAFVDTNASRSRDPSGLNGAEFSDNVLAPQRKLSFTAGGLPGSTAASDAVKRVQVNPMTSFGAFGSTHSFAALFRNVADDVVAGVSFARLIPTSGPNAPTSSTSGTFASSCGSSGNEGQPATCTYSPHFAGTDTVLAFVNQTTAAGNTSPTFGRDSGEPFDAATAVTTATPVAASQARILTLMPETTTVSPGEVRQFVATVTDANGAPANGVSVTFSEDGPGFLRGGTIAGASSTVTFTTGDPATISSGSGPPGPGRALALFATNPGDAGSNTVSASITDPTATQCQQNATSTLPAGQCTDTSLLTITASASPSPRVTASATPTATVSPEPTVTPMASASPGTCSVSPTVALNPSTINATGSAGLTVRAPAGEPIELLAYSQPSSTYRVVRTGVVDPDGAEEFTIRPPTNTRLYARVAGCTTDHVTFSKVLNVRTTLSLFVARNGRQDYTFSGDSLPARPGGLIVSLYRITDAGRQVLTAQARARSDNGQWRIRRVFTGTGRFGLILRTGQDLQNAPGASNVRSLLVY